MREKLFNALQELSANDYAVIMMVLNEGELLEGTIMDIKVCHDSYWTKATFEVVDSNNDYHRFKVGPYLPLQKEVRDKFGHYHWIEVICRDFLL